MLENESEIIAVWQHPFVNIFKQYKIETWNKVKKEGNVQKLLDRQIKCTIYKIQGYYFLFV